jgi:hypothetical protein
VVLLTVVSAACFALCRRFSARSVCHRSSVTSISDFGTLTIPRAIFVNRSNGLGSLAGGAFAFFFTFAPFDRDCNCGCAMAARSELKEVLAGERAVRQTPTDDVRKNLQEPALVVVAPVVETETLLVQVTEQVNASTDT